MSLEGVRVLVSGAGVAGPAVAWWLAEHGATVTVVEIAKTLRTSGFAVDFRGSTHLGVLRGMGVLDELTALRTRGGAMTCVTADGREIFTLPAEFAGGDLEVRRRDLSRVLYERSAPRVEYLFRDRVTGLVNAPDSVAVEFAHAAPRTFDFVIGADGLHSGVRVLTHGPETDYVRHLDYYIAGWDLPNPGVDTTPLQYNQPGRMASVSADRDDETKAGALVVFAAPRVDHDWFDTDRHKALITKALTGMGWHVPKLLDGLRAADDLYFDSISRVRVPHWSTGRVALLGDAAWGVTLGGMGVGTGLVGAYVLAGELARANGNPAALKSYEDRMRPYTTRWQRGANPGKFLAPATASGLWLRNTLFSTAFVRRMLVAGTATMATADLPDYQPQNDRRGSTTARWAATSESSSD
ncbi:FAD-dependent monooxygenase [Actinokineospora inagensis]|uniref:FAD-dependent monooxygenase n=1 Tax=Actinokineospora inagensis TaxID=103730 RepID=UPI0009FF05E4|nr:FAD-dependent monooxygenase [Actinokineospora inagensis]